MVEPNFTQPIVGNSLVTDIQSSPLKNPPQFSTIDETIDFYIQRMTTDEFSDKLIYALEAGVSVSQIANLMQLHGVMEGQHTLDVSIMILPILMEFIRYIAETRGVEYDLGIDEYDPSKADDALIVNAVKKLERENRQAGIPELDLGEEEPIEQDQTEEPEEERTVVRGLMERGI